MKKVLFICLNIISYGLVAQSVHPIKSLSLRQDTIEKTSDKVYVAITQNLLNNDSSITIDYGNEIYVFNTASLSKTKSQTIQMGKSACDIIFTIEDNKPIYLIQNLVTDMNDPRWKEIYIKIIFTDLLSAKKVILMAEVHDRELFNIGFELK